MTEPQMVFRRHERKYILTEGGAKRLRQRLAPYLIQDEYGQYSILSLYFDTPDFRALRQGSITPHFKEKLRLRSYGTPGAGDTVFLEQKKKLDGVGYKRREAMALREAYRFLQSGIRPEGSGQVLEEIDWFLRRYSLEPKLIIGYNREAFVGKQQAGVRVTFDTDICWRDDALRLEAGPGGERLLPPGSVLMEAKSDSALPLWLVHACSEAGAYPTHFSKYATAAGLLLRGEEARHAG